MRAGIFPDLLQMVAHRRARGFRVAPIDGRKNSRVMVLAALRSAIFKKYPHALFAQQSDD
jgi:hypothetical protein